MKRKPNTQPQVEAAPDAPAWLKKGAKSRKAMTAPTPSPPQVVAETNIVPMFQVGDTRLAVRHGISSTLPGVRLDRSQADACHAKITVVTERLTHHGLEGEDRWTVVKRHASFYGASADRCAEACIKLLQNGATEASDNRCIADGLSLESVAQLGNETGFNSCLFPGAPAKAAKKAKR